MTSVSFTLKTRSGGARRGPGCRLRCALFASAVLAMMAHLCAPAPAWAREDAGPVRPQVPGAIPGPSLEVLDETGVGTLLDEVQSQLEAIPSYNWREIVRDVLSGKGPDWRRVGAAVCGKLLGEVVTVVPFLGKLVLVCVVMGLLDILASSLGKDGVTFAATWGCFLVLAVMAWSSFRECTEIAREALQGLVTLLYAVIPVLGGLMASSGAPVSAAALQPLVLGAGYMVATVISDVAFPLLYTATAMEFAFGLGVEGRSSGVSEFLRQVAVVLTGIMMSAFVGAVVSQKASAGVVDGVALRTAKYLSSTFVPVAGKMVSDTMDMFFVASSALRSALGMAGALLVFAVSCLPLVKILLILLAWKVAVALGGSFLPGAVGKSMKAVGSAIALVATSVGLAAFTFVICVSLVAGAVRAF